MTKAVADVWRNVGKPTYWGAVARAAKAIYKWEKAKRKEKKTRAAYQKCIDEHSSGSESDPG